MYAHVTTYRLGTSSEIYEDIWRATETGEPISDQTARTIASYWHSLSERARNLTALSHGLPFDTDNLAHEITHEITDPDDRDALTEWLYCLTDLLVAS